MPVRCPAYPPSHHQAWGLIAGDSRARERLYGFLLDFFHQRSAAISAAIRDGLRRGRFDAEADAVAVTDAIVALRSGFLYRGTFDPEHADPERLTACFDALVRNAFYAQLPVPVRREGDGV